MFFDDRLWPVQVFKLFTLQKGEVMAGKLFKRWPSNVARYPAPRVEMNDGDQPMRFVELLIRRQIVA
jgi:hypothetical protein